MHTKFPHIMDMSIHLDMDLRNRSCQPCTPDHPLGPQCCGMCGFWENLRYKNVERQPWVAPCNIRDVRPNFPALSLRYPDLQLNFADRL